MMLKPVFIITMVSVVMIVGLGIILYLITMPEDVSQNNMELQDALDMCTNDVGNMQSSGSLEKCLDDAYETFGTEEQKQIWFDDKH
jgi:hypothetical protein